MRGWNWVKSWFRVEYTSGQRICLLALSKGFCAGIFNWDPYEFVEQFMRCSPEHALLWIELAVPPLTSSFTSHFRAGGRKCCKFARCSQPLGILAWPEASFGTVAHAAGPFTDCRSCRDTKPWKERLRHAAGRDHETSRKASTSYYHAV